MVERHHVLPRSLGGTNKKTNITRLTAREHFICHLLLTKFTTGEAKKKMIFAARYMLVTRRGLKVTSRKYDRLRTEHRLLASASLRGRVFSPETIAKMSESQKKNQKRLTIGATPFSIGYVKSNEHCANISKGKLGKSTKWSTPENRQAVSKALTGLKKSTEHIANMIKAQRGRPAHNKGKPSPRRGIPLSEETRGKMRKPKNEEMKRKLREFYARKREAKIALSALID